MSNSTLNPKVAVVLIKGFATDSFAYLYGTTPGIDLINNYLNDTYKDNSNIEYISKTYQWDQKSKVLQDIEDLSLTSQDKLIIIGHSLGGDTSVEVADDLNKTNQSKKNVDLLGQIDSVGYGDDKVLNNVDRRVNYYQEGDNPAFRDVARNIESADADINVETLLKKKLTHGEIDDDPFLGGLIKDEIDATIDEDKPKPKYDEEQIEKIKAEKIQYYCFTAGTPILMSDGTYKPIEQVKIGDEVMAFEGLGKLQPRKVIQTFITPDQEVVQLGDIKVTLGHHFLQPDGSFKALGEIDKDEFLVGVTGKLIPHPGIKPVAGKHTVYNFAVEDLHTYVAGDFRVHNESLSLYQPVSMGGLIGASLGGQIASLYADDKFASQLIAQSLGQTVGGYVIDAINYELDADFYKGDSLSLAALYKRLPASVIQTGIGLASGELSESIIKAFKIEDPLAQIGVSTLTNAAVNYAVSEVIVNSLVDSFGVQKGTEYALTYFGISTDTSTAILNPDVSSVDIISTNLVDIGASALGSFLGSELYSKLVYQWNVLSEDYSPDGAAIGATIGGIIGTYAIPIPVVGTAIGSLIGSIIGGAFGDRDYPRAGYNVSVVNGAFVNRFGYDLDKGNASLASQMSNNAKELLNYFSVLVGGKLLSSELIAYGHLEGEYIYYPHSRSPGYFGGSSGRGRVGFGNAQSAIVEGIIYQLTTTRFEGGDLYIKRALKNIQLHGNSRPVSVNTVDKLIDVFQVAQEYGIYKDNPYLYEKTIQYYIDNGIEIEIFRFADGSEYTPLLTTTNTVTLQPLLGKSEHSPDNTQLSPNFTLSPHKLAVVDVTGDGIRLMPANDSLTQYDIDNDSYPEQIGCFAPTDGFLVRDVNKDGNITTLNEFFSLTPQDNVTHLATLDSNGDTLITADDTHFHDLRIWRDANLNATVELEELTALWRYGINSLSILPQAKDYTVAGNKITASAYLTRVGVETRTTAKLHDVQFAHNPNGVKLESLGNGFAQFNYENKRNILFTEQDSENLTLTIDAEQVYSVTGSTGNDVLTILDKNKLGVVVNGGDRNDILIGGDGNDVITGGEGSDRIFANGGDDIITIDGWDNLAHIDGGEGTDVLIIEGDDPVSLSLSDLNVEIVTGNDQNNFFTYDGTSSIVMEGGKGNDTMRGGSNDDILNGGDGDDILMGSGGRNTLTGGNGADIYNILTSNHPDIITDFDVTEDKIQLQGKPEDYYLGSLSDNLSQGIGIFSNNDQLIGMITGVFNLSLEQSAFSFV